MALTSAMEDYLEAVLMMQKRHGYVRCVDVAEHLGVKNPSVSRAVKELSKSGHLVKNADGTLSLTELGLQFAEQIYEKHQFSPGSSSRLVYPRILRHRTLANWNTSSVKRAIRN